MWKVGCGRSNFVTMASCMPSSLKMAIRTRILMHIVAHFPTLQLMKQYIWPHHHPPLFRELLLDMHWQGKQNKNWWKFCRFNPSWDAWLGHCDDFISNAWSTPYNIRQWSYSKTQLEDVHHQGALIYSPRLSHLGHKSNHFNNTYQISILSTH